MSIADHLSNDNVLDLRALATSRTYAQVVSAQKSQFSLEAVLRSAVTAVLLDTKQVGPISKCWQQQAKIYISSFLMHMPPI